MRTWRVAGVASIFALAAFLPRTPQDAQGSGVAVEIAVAIHVSWCDEEFGLVPLRFEVPMQLRKRDCLIEGQAFSADSYRIDLRILASFKGLPLPDICLELMDRLGHAVEPVVQIIAAECAVQTPNQRIVGQVLIGMEPDQSRALPQEACRHQGDRSGC